MMSRSFSGTNPTTSSYVEFISGGQALFILAVLFVLVYLLPLNFRPLFIPDEVRYGEIAREMLASGNWVVPNFIGLRYFEKPPMGHWLNALSLYMFSETPLGVRFASTLSTGLTALAVFFLVLKTTARVYPALLSALIYLTFLQVFIIGIISTLDAMLTFWLSLAMMGFFLAELQLVGKKTGYVLLGLFCGLAFLTKGFLALAVPVMVIVPYMIWQRRFVELLLHGWIPILVAALVVLPWGLLIHNQEPDFWRYFFWEEHIKRFTADDAHHSEPPWFFIPIIVVFSLPWVMLFPLAIARLASKQADPDTQLAAKQVKLLRFSLLWLIVPFVFFSVSRGKLPTYILPCFVPLAIIFGLGLERAYGMTSPLRTVFQKVLETLTGILHLLLAGGFMIAIIAMQWLEIGEPLYRQPGDNATFKTLLFMLGLWLWIAFAWLFMRKKQQWPHLRPFYVALVPMALMLIAPLNLPDKALQVRAPGAFLAAQKNYLDRDTVLIAEHVMMGAVSWFYQRDDVYLTGGKGELRYGLGFDDDASRHVPYAELASFIDRSRQQRTVMFFDKSSSFDEPLYVPAADMKITSGQFILRLYLPAGKKE